MRIFHCRNVGITVTRLEYLFLFLVILFLGSATVFTDGSLESVKLAAGVGIEALIGKAIMVLLSVLLISKKNIPIKKCFDSKIVIVLIIFGILQYIKYRTLSPYVLVRLFNLYFACLIIRVYNKKLIYLFETIVSKLALIGLILWFFLILMPPVMEFLLDLSPIKGAGLVDGGSWLVFGRGHQYEIVIRNIGFAWEPGRFGSILVVAVFFNLIINKFKIKNNRHFWILTLAVLSTQSTTSYLGYIFCLVFMLYNKKSKYFIYLLPVAILATVGLMSLDFMGSKLNDLSIFNEEHQDEWNQQIDFYASQERTIVPQRFDALLMEGMNILHDPLIGNATDPSGYLYSIFGLQLSLSNGVLRIFANMGIFIGILYYILWVKSSIWMSRCYCYKGTLAFFVVLFMINVSYSWIFEPIFLAFVLYPYIVKKTARLAQIKPFMDGVKKLLVPIF